MRILIVEDNADVTRQIKSALIHELYVVDIALDGEEGHKDGCRGSGLRGGAHLPGS